MRVILQILWEMAVVLVVIGMLAAVLAVPLYGLITVLLWESMRYQGAFYISLTLLLGICVVLWVVELAKGVRI